jgi:predicted enzyme related to lactoylglutathione lyase
MKDVPTHWASYVSVTSADETAAKATSLGGTVYKEPFDVFDAGRMAVIADPAGAVFCIWQPNKHAGIGVKGAANTLCWNELLTNDTDKAKDFYTKLFGWSEQTHGEPMQYTEWTNNGKAIGGMMKIREDMGPVPPNWGMYIAVENCDSSAEKAKSLGANVCVGPMDIPTVGRFAVLSDPQGAMFSIIQLAPQAH